ncbi:MAG: chemotaxis protein CheW [Limisphaerales bacterium]
MLALVFQIGADRFGLPSAAIEEVIALVNLRHLPAAPEEIPGDFNYHGELVPVIDLCQLSLHRPSHRRWSTRLILTRVADPVAAGKLVGLITENATELVPPPDESDASLKLLQLEELLSAETLNFLAEHETEPPPEPTPETETQARRRRAPRLSHLDRK